MKRGYLRFLRESASIIGAKSVPALANTYSTPRSASRARKASDVMALPFSTASPIGWAQGGKPAHQVGAAIAQSVCGVERTPELPLFHLIRYVDRGREPDEQQTDQADGQERHGRDSSEIPGKAADNGRDDSACVADREHRRSSAVHIVRPAQERRQCQHEYQDGCGGKPAYRRG